MFQFIAETAATVSEYHRPFFRRAVLKYKGYFSEILAYYQLFLEFVCKSDCALSPPEFM